MTLRLAVADADVCLCAQYEGISRMQTSLRRRHRDRVVRYAACLFAMPSHTMSETNGG